MIVVDASAALSALYHDGAARDALATDRLHAPHLIDSELAGGIRRRVLAGDVKEGHGWMLLDAWRRMGVRRYAVFTLLDRIWALRHNVSTYDAAYIALAEQLECTLLTADGRLGRAPGIRCPVTVVPR